MFQNHVNVALSIGKNCLSQLPVLYSYNYFLVHCQCIDGNVEIAPIMKIPGFALDNIIIENVGSHLLQFGRG